MSEKLLDILKPKGDCIPEELLIRYAEGKISAEEARRVEEHVSECEFCSDALDGIMQNGNAREFHSTISSIKKIVHKKMRSSEPSTTFPITRMLAIAATLLILAISAWYVQYAVNDNSQKVFSDQFKPYPAPPVEDKSQAMPPAVTESKKEAEQTIKFVPKTPLANSAPAQEKKEESAKSLEAPPPQEQVTVDQPTLGATKENTDATVFDDVSSDKFRADSPVVFSLKESPQATSANYSAAPSQSISITESHTGMTLDEIQVASKSKDSYKVNTDANFNNAMSLYQANRYAEAIAEFQIVLKQEPNNAAANFYSGVSSLALKNPDEALKYFKKTDYKSCQYYEASLWYEALSYLSKDDKKQAKNLLEKVVILNGEYKVKAEETLKQL